MDRFAALCQVAAWVHYVTPTPLLRRRSVACIAYLLCCSPSPLLQLGRSSSRGEERYKHNIMENMASHAPTKLSYKLLKQITNDFDKERILGSGGFGTVYKGELENRREIAVKVLHNISGLDDKEFHKELDNLRGLKHPNIVELVGFCNESEKKPAMFEGEQVFAEQLHLALCFEYVQNGSLNKHISDEDTGFTWHTRYTIIKGICEGLKYLCEGLEYPIMHLDLKPDNILLDKSMVPKIADFGLSKLFGKENTKKTGSPAGTCGYWPPEYINNQIISREFDIFSLGVIIVKIMTGHKAYCSVVEMTTRKAIWLVHESWKKNLRKTLSHTSVEVYCNQVKSCIEIALDCLKPNRLERPAIQNIVSRLNETETMIGDRGMQNEQFYQSDGEFTLPSKIRSIPINYGPTSDTFMENLPDLKPVAMSWGLLKEMTDDFSKERLLGQGRYGSVYKGVNGDGQVIVVKILEARHGRDDMVLRDELQIFKMVHHQNIVQLVGYCSEKEEHVVWRNRKHVISTEIHNALCFEHLRGGSLEQYISPDTSSQLGWQTQYKIIKGVCEVLRYLHEGMQSHIIHRNLKPSKILMDDQKMVPKIGGFNLAKLVGADWTHTGTIHGRGTFEYMPPEFAERGLITKGYDIFSLGVIILELMTGRKTYRELYDGMSSKKFIAMAHKKWRERLQKTVSGTSVEGYWQQIKKCLEIALKCVERERHKRPTIGNIIRMLNETETLIPQLLLEVRPLELCFLAAMSSDVASEKKAARMSSSCSLQLKNKANDRVAFMLVANSPKRYLTKEPLCGVVPPRCVYTLTLTMRNKKLSSDSGSIDFFTLYSLAVDKYDLLNVDRDSVSEEYDNFFKKAKEEVQEVTLKVICDRPAADQGTSPYEPTRPAVEIITMPDTQQVSFIDVHPKEPWIMTTNQVGSLRVWNYHTMAALNSFHLAAYEPVYLAKFITREKWLVIGDRDGGILVYNYEEEDVESFDAHDSCITTLAVHPTSPFLLSSSEDDDHLIKLWDWGNGWKCTHEFGGHTGRVMHVTFNPENNDSFASASLDGTVKIWSICSDDPNNIITLKLAEHGLCADYFTRDNRQHMIVGCKERTAQIWELGMKGRVYELEGHEDHITAVSLHQELQILITGSLDGAVRIWNSTTYKIENIICFNLGAVYAFRCIKGLRRIMVGCHQGIAMMDSNLFKKAKKEVEDVTLKVICDRPVADQGTSSSEISEQQLDSEGSELLLEVHPLKLRFLAAREKKAPMMSSSCSLHLKNKANHRIAFMLVAKNPKRYLTKKTLCGVVPPRCVHTLALITRNKKASLGSGRFDFFTLYSIKVDEWDLLNVDKDSISDKYDSFFKKAKEEVQKMTLKVICGRPAADQGTPSSEPTRPAVEIITTHDARQVSFIDVHPTEPWIMTTNHVGSLRVWNYHTMAALNSFQLGAYEPVHVAKFITREKWLIAGDHDGGIVVYNYEDKGIKRFDAHERCITTLGVHPTSPFLLSSSQDDDHLIKLWDWGNGWKCTREFRGHTDRVMEVTFNPENNDSFVSVSLDGTVKIWSICSDNTNDIITLKLSKHGLSADYFTRYNQQHLIVGCEDGNAQIWELRKEGRVYELEGHEDCITAVSLHPELEMLITGSLDGAIRIWNSATYKLENIIGFNLGAVYALGCIKGQRRIIVGCHQGIAMTTIDSP